MTSILDILGAYYTAEEVQKQDELLEELRKLDKLYEIKYKGEFRDFKLSLKNGETILVEGWKNDYFNKREEIGSQLKALDTSVQTRYKEEKGQEGILKDVQKIADSYEKEDYLQHLENIRRALKRLEELERFNIHTKVEGEDQEGRSFQTYLRQNSEESYRGCFGYIYENNSILEELLDGEGLEQVVEIFKARIDSFGYERPTEGVLSYRGGGDASQLPALPKYDFVYPTDFQQNLTKASKKIFDSSIALSDLKQREIDITPNKKGILRTYAITVDLTAPELKGTENVTEYDKSVHNVAVSIGKANKHGFFTARELATVLYYGDNPSHSRPSPQQIGAVTKSIEKQALIRLTIDWTEHIKLNNKGNLPEDATNFKVKDYMLPVREYTATIGGKTLHGYQFIDPVKLSPLYQYATSVGQIGQHPVKMLNVPINLDQQKLVIRDFLLEEIAHIKNRESWNNTLSVEKLLKVAGEDNQTIRKEKRKKLLDAVEDMLTYWTEGKYIKGFKKNRAETKGRPLQSFTITA